MKLRSKFRKNIKCKRKYAKLVAGFYIAFSMALSGNITSYAFARPNITREVEPNNTKETAQLTTQNNEIATVVAMSDWSGRYLISGITNSSDDDWYKVVLTPGDQYLTVGCYTKNASMQIELFDSENKIIVPGYISSDTDMVVKRFQSNGGTYYVHIEGTSETDTEYNLSVGSPRVISHELNIQFDRLTTSGTIYKSFSLKNETILPRDSIVSSISVLNSSEYSSARVTSSAYPKTFTTSDGTIKDLGLKDISLKSDWELIYYPKGSTADVSPVRFLFVYPLYDDTVIPPPFHTIKK